LSNILPVILCGGSGSRLWPLSRKSLPKQFVSLFGDKNLLEQTLDRVVDFSESGKVITIANIDHRFLIHDSLAYSKAESLNILEPVGRNTTAATISAALNVNPDQLLLFLPADHHIPNKNYFQETVKSAEVFAENGSFVTFGIKPSSPHIGYGYIKTKDNTNNNNLKQIYEVEKFVEKPSLKQAAEYLKEGNFFWNSGIFLVKASILIEATKMHAIDIYNCVSNAVKHQKIVNEDILLDIKTFTDCRSESLDFAVLEKIKNISMVPYTESWSDVGSWDAVAEFSASDDNQNRKVGDGHFFDTKSTYIHATHRPVIAIGTNDLIIVDTKDAVLVSSAGLSERIKDVVTMLEKQKYSQASEHRFARRPWGEFDTIEEEKCFKVKRIKVKPGASLSLQLHYKRAEHWIVVKGTARVTCGEKVFTLVENESTYIPRETQHRLENIGNDFLEMIEVQSGTYLGEDDIVRFEDSYGRASEVDIKKNK